MPGLAEATIEGHLGKKPELTQTRNGKDMCKVSIAVSEGEGQNQKTSWFYATVAGPRAKDLAAELDKGDAIQVKGRLQINEYQGKTYVEVFAWTFWGRPKKGTGAPASRQQPQQQKQDPVEQMKVPEVIDDQSLPF